MLQTVEYAEEVVTNNANPSLLARLASYARRRLWIIIVTAMLALILLIGDTASWRRHITPIIIAMIVKDPTIVLNRAWSNLENRNNPEALTAARCVRLMPSSSDEQRRQADFVISLIDEITSTEMNNHQLRNVSLDASLVKRIQRIRDVSTGQYAALGQPQVKPSEKATTSNISSRVLPHGLSEGLPQICADHSMAILHTDGGTDATSRFKQQAFK